jgi:fructokinase
MIDVFGEALVDAHLEGSIMRMHLGGGPFNTAVALGRLGIPVAFGGALSSDAFGVRLRDTLADAGVAHRASTVDAPTPLAVVAPGCSNEVEYRFYLEGTAFELLADTLEPSPAAAATFVGSLALAVDPPGEAVTEIAIEAAMRSALVIDPNVRPALVESLSDYRARLERLVPLASIVKLSRADGSWLYPDLEPPEVARRLLGIGATCVVITNGPDGASGWTHDVSAHVETPRVRVVDTVGAGDAFSAGFVARLWQGQALTRERIEHVDREALTSALAYGTAAGAAQCERASAWGPHVADVERLFNDHASRFAESTKGG